jgi:hypothetical protein
MLSCNVIVGAFVFLLLFLTFLVPGIWTESAMTNFLILSIPPALGALVFGAAELMDQPRMSTKGP